MTRPRTFQDYVELWQEQIGEEELAELRARAKALAGSINRRWLRDGVLAVLAVGTACLFLFYSPAPLQAKLSFVPLVALLVGIGWGRHRIVMAARAIAVDHPHFFFESAIRNVQLELGLSRFCLWAGLPVFMLTLALVKASQGADLVDWLRRLPRDISLVEITGLAVLFLGFVFFVREHGKMRAQLRSLETMRREWDDQATR